MMETHYMRVAWGSWAPDGRWFPNPNLAMSADEQWRQNEANGYNEPLIVPKTEQSCRLSEELDRIVLSPLLRDMELWLQVHDYFDGHDDSLLK